ncbi:hypothetical protein [Nonomuraea basaltis]|uniref:galactose-1-phosphate uridylyltransferase n=1 Tax=Nonomuraea basaltis TaxID=2495887 RepID=UPI0014874490|nr:hypothetical protein [Nonomuraea basaltis]
MSFVPLRHRHLFDVSRAHYDDDAGRCLYADLVDAEIEDGRRLVDAGDRAVAFVPYAAHMPYEIWLAPFEHRASFADASDDALQAVGALLLRVLAGLRRLLGDVPYNYVVISAPNGEQDTPYFLWHVRIIPRLSVPAGFELGSGMAINTVPPEQAAERLRAAIGSRPVT